MSVFRTIVQVKPLPQAISTNSKIYFTGSCFAENIAEKVAANRLPVLCNPFGIIYNPLSIAKTLEYHISDLPLHNEQLQFYNERYFHFDFHSKMAHPEQAVALKHIKEARDNGKTFLQQTTHLVITFGTAFAYFHKSSGEPVANNHKLPSTDFDKKLLSVETIVTSWLNIIKQLKSFNNKLIVIFTISPVRHWRDGAVENNLSKSVLIQSVQQLVQQIEDTYYFPAYEIMMDELRDYRFYAEDMLHPNATAIQYIWDKFSEACVDERGRICFKQMAELNAAIAHKPFFETSFQHQQFKKNMLEKSLSLQQIYPELDLSDAVGFFN